MNIKRIGLIGGNGVSIGGSGGTGSSAIVVDNLESLSKSAALSANMGRELNETKAPKVGYAPDLKVTYAEELVGRGDSTNNIISSIRPTSGKETSIKDGNATIDRIKGKSVVWNQLLNNKSLPNTGVYNDVELTNNNNGTFTVNGTPLSSLASILINFGIQKHGHKYLCEGIPSRNAITETFFRIHYIEDGNNNPLKTVDETGNCFFSLSTTIDVELRCYFYIHPNYTVTNETYAPKLYDLTLMFGEGNEPTTIEEFEARKPLGVTNEYNEGTIISFQGGDIKSVGFNAWDEEWELGGFFRGQKITAETYSKTIRSKNYIPVIGGCEYFVTSPIAMYANFFDKQYKYIDKSNRIPSNTKIVVPSNAAYMWIRNFDNTYGTTYNHDICIHLIHSGYRNRDYEPYVEDIHSLPDIKSIKDNNGDVLFPYGLLSAGNVHDEITASKAIKRIGVVDMGSFTWRTMTHTDKQVYFISSDNKVNKIKQSISASIPANLMCIPYQPGPSTGLIASGDKRIARNAQTPGSLYVYDTFYTDVTTFKAAMQGVLLYYELTEAIEVDLPEPLNMTYDAWDFGTEELISTNVTTPLNADIVYLFNAVDRIRENSKHVEESEKKLTKLQFHVDDRSSDNIELLSNGNLKLTLKGITKEFMPATPSGDPMHYAYEVAGAEYNGTTDFIVKDAPWKDMVDTIEDKAKWGFDVVDASQVKQMTINGNTYNYVQTTRQSPQGTTEPRYFLVGQASDGTWVEDETKVLHLPGHWYLNGLGDITGKEMKRVWEAPHNARYENAYVQLKNRTIFLIGNGNGAPCNYTNFIRDSKIETIVFEQSLYPTSDSVNPFFNIYVKYIYCITNNQYIYGYANIKQESTKPIPLRVLPLYKLNKNCYLGQMRSFSKPSLLYIINNAVPTTPITITLHADRYAQLSEDTDIIAALEAKNAALEDTNGSISLVSA